MLVERARKRMTIHQPQIEQQPSCYHTCKWGWRVSLISLLPSSTVESSDLTSIQLIPLDLLSQLESSSSQLRKLSLHRLGPSADQLFSRIHFPPPLHFQQSLHLHHYLHCHNTPFPPRQSQLLHHLQPQPGLEILYIWGTGFRAKKTLGA